LQGRAGGCRIPRMKNLRRETAVFLLLVAFGATMGFCAGPNEPAALEAMAEEANQAQDEAEPALEGTAEKPVAQAVVIVCKGLIDDGLYKSIKRRTELAIAGGAEYVIYRIETYGGLLDAADNIAKYLILDVADEVDTVAFITTEAISAGAMIAVSCRDIVMRENTTIGDCAPIQIGATLEGVEREKAESFVRVAFDRASEANGYPRALLRAMVTMQAEVHRVKNNETGEYEFFETEDLPSDAEKYDLDGKELVDKEDEILTLTAARAHEYGIARAVVKDIGGVLEYLSARDGVEFEAEPVVLRTNWSEEMVRWVNSPAVMAILFTVALLGLYVELNTPGIGLPGLVAVICFVILVGSKYLIGMANWIEVALFVVGICLLVVEIFVIPGFGVVGMAGILCIFAGLFGMLVKNPPDRLPWPQTAFDWQLFISGAWALALGFLGFMVLAVLVTKYLPRLEFLSGLILAPTGAKSGREVEVSMTAPPGGPAVGLERGQVGQVVSKLRPAGKASFGDAIVDVVAEGELLDKGTKVKIITIRGNRVVVKKAES